MLRKCIALVQQGVWAMPMESMPLAVGYLKAAVDADEVLRQEYETVIVNLRGGISVGTTMSMLFGDGVPDVLAISVFGWNFREALVLCETFKQLNANGLTVLGGTHVANQSDRIFRLSPDVDVIVNGEGERAFPELLHARLAGEFLSGAISMTDVAGQFRYDVAIMETNRGCPYHCAFCYWGGAIGQKIRRFPRERLLAELDIFAHYKVNSVVLCDANFGMQAQDEEFLDDVIRLRERTGFPRAVESSWAKNKSQTFYRIVRKMKAAGLHSSFTIALQTLNDTALSGMNRRNMRLNDWRTLVEWLGAEGTRMLCRAHLGRPGRNRRVLPGGLRRACRARPAHRHLSADAAAQHRLPRPASEVRARHGAGAVR